jgi:hypothetical protein
MKTLKREAKIMIQWTVRIPEGLAEKVKIKAIHDKVTLQQLMADLLADYIKRPARPREDQR